MTVCSFDDVLEDFREDERVIQQPVGNKRVCTSLYRDRGGSNVPRRRCSLQLYGNLSTDCGALSDLIECGLLSAAEATEAFVLIAELFLPQHTDGRRQPVNPSLKLEATALDASRAAWSRLTNALISQPIPIPSRLDRWLDLRER